MSTDDTDESLEVESILDDLNHSEDNYSEDGLLNRKSIEDEDFPSYKSVVLDNLSNDKTFKGNIFITKLAWMIVVKSYFEDDTLYS